VSTEVSASDITAEYSDLLAIGYTALKRADELLIRHDLEKIAGRIQQEIAEAEADAAASEAQLRPAQTERDRLQSELRECISRAADIQSATADDSLEIRVSARSMRLAFQEESASLQARLDQVDAAVTRYHDEIGQARHAIDQHQQKLALIAEAMESPFTHPLAQELPAYAVRMFSCRTLTFLLAGLKDHPEYDSAMSMLYHIMKVTGVGKSIEDRVESGVKDLYAEVHFLPDGTPVRYRNASAEQIRQSAKPAVRTESGVEQQNTRPTGHIGLTGGLPGQRPGDVP
jgi:hypothetical protein